MPTPHLRLVPDLGAYQIHAGALRKTHIGKLIGTTHHETAILGRLKNLTNQGSWIITRIGLQQLALRPTHPVYVLPDDQLFVITNATQTTPGGRRLVSKPEEIS